MNIAIYGDPHESKMENNILHLPGDCGLFADGVGRDTGPDHKISVQQAIIGPVKNGTGCPIYA